MSVCRNDIKNKISLLYLSIISLFIYLFIYLHLFWKLLSVDYPNVFQKNSPQVWKICYDLVRICYVYLNDLKRFQSKYYSGEDSIFFLIWVIDTTPNFIISFNHCGAMKNRCIKTWNISFIYIIIWEMEVFNNLDFLPGKVVPKFW